MRPMISMAYDDEDQGDLVEQFPVLAGNSEYPPNLRFALTDKDLRKIGSDGTECVKDGILHLHILARITHVMHSDGDMGKSCRVELQIEDIAAPVESEGDETDED